MGQMGWGSPLVLSHCPHIGGINLSPCWPLAGGPAAAATCSQSLWSYPAPGGRHSSGLCMQHPHPAASGRYWGVLVLQPCLLLQVPGSLSRLLQCDMVIWCLPGPSLSGHHHCCGCPTPQSCKRWVSVPQRPPEASALSPALWSLMAVTPQPHHGMPASPSACSCCATAGRARVGHRAMPECAAWQEEKMWGWCFGRC